MKVIRMNKSNFLKLWLEANGDKVKIAYSYAIIHKLDITSQDDVLKVLQAVDPDNANKVQADLYSKIMQLFRDRFKKTAEKVFED